MASSSLCAVGGVPGSGQFMAGTANMLAALAARNDTQERRLAALEKTVALREGAMNQIATTLARVARELIGLRP